MSESGIGSSPSYQCEREDITDANAIVFQICGTFSMVLSSMRTRSVSTSACRSSWFHTRSQSGM